MITSTSTLALALICALPMTASAQDTVIKTVSGHTYTGTVVSDDGQKLMVKTSEGMEMGIPYGDIAPTTLYQIELGRGADDAAGQVKLGDMAEAAELWSSAKKHYHNAIDLDASVEKDVDAKLAGLRVKASNWLVAEAKEELGRGKQGTAEQHLNSVLSEFPKEKAAAEAATMLADLHQKQTADREAASDARQSKEIQDALAPAEKKLDESKADVRKGLADSDNQSRSIEDFKRAVKKSEEGRDHLKQLAAKAKDDAALASAITELDGALVDQIVNADIQLTNAYNQRSSYNDANTTVNKALALQPKNQQLLNLREQIASNNAESGVAYGPWYGRRVVGTKFRR